MEACRALACDLDPSTRGQRDSVPTTGNSGLASSTCRAPLLQFLPNKAVGMPWKILSTWLGNGKLFTRVFPRPHQGHTNDVIPCLCSRWKREPLPLTAPSFGVVYCSFCYWSRMLGMACASKGAKKAPSGTADLFGSASTQHGLGGLGSYMSDLYVVLWSSWPSHFSI